MAKLQELAIRITADSSSYQREMNRALIIGKGYYKTMEDRSKRFDIYIANNNRSIQAMNTQLTHLKSSALKVAAAYIGSFDFTSVINMADNWGQAAARVKMAITSVEGSADSYNLVQDRLLEISNRNAKSISDSQELYVSTASSMHDLGYSTEQTLDFIEAMSNSYTLNATGADKVKTNIDAITNSMITGRVSSKQWESLMLSTPNIVNELSKSTGWAEKSVIQLGSNGQISMRQLADAMIAAKDRTGELVDGMGNTVKGGFTQLSNNFNVLIGNLNSSVGFTQRVAGGLKLVADNIDLVSGAGAAFVGIGLSRYFGRLSESIVNATKTTLGNKTAQISKAQAELSAAKSLQLKAVAEVNAARFEAQRAVGLKANLIAQNNLTAAINRQTQANAALAASQANVNALTNKFGLLSRAGSGLLGLLGGPVGLATTLFSVGAGFLMMGDGADKAKKPLEELQLPLDELIAKYKEAGKAHQQTIISELTVNVEANSKSADEKLNNLQNELRKRLTKYKPNSKGTYPAAESYFDDGDKNALSEFITKYKELIEQLEKGRIYGKEFSDRTGEVNIKFVEAVNGSDQFGISLGNLLKDLLLTSEELAENREKLDAVVKASEKTGTSIKKLDIADFPNLENQLGVLNQELEVNKLKADKNGETAYVLAGLQRAAGDAALEHASALSALAKGADLSGQMEDSLLQKLTLLVQKLRENYKEQEKLAQKKTGKSTADIYKNQLDRLNNQINAYTDITELQKVRRQIAEGELSKLSEIQKTTLETKAAELDRLNAQKEYKSILDSLRSPAEQQLDTYKEQLSIAEKANLSLKEREELLDKMFNKSAESVPTFSYNNSYNGIGSDLLNVAEDDKKLQDWHNQQLKLFDDLLKEKKIKQQEYADAIVKIEEKMQKKQNDIQDAYTLATLGTFSSLTGSIAEMFKETAGESSTAYKVMFLASKAASIAQAVISTEVAAAKALELGPIMGIPAASLIRGLGYASVGLIAAQTISGMAHRGIDNIPQEGTWLLDKGERVVDARTNADLKEFLQTSNKSGSNITVNVPVNIGDRGLSDTEGKQLGKNIKEAIRLQIQYERRPGGLLNKR